MFLFVCLWNWPGRLCRLPTHHRRLTAYPTRPLALLQDKLNDEVVMLIYTKRAVVSVCIYKHVIVMPPTAKFLGFWLSWREKNDLPSRGPSWNVEINKGTAELGSWDKLKDPNQPYPISMCMEIFCVNITILHQEYVAVAQMWTREQIVVYSKSLINHSVTRKQTHFEKSLFLHSFAWYAGVRYFVGIDHLWVILLVSES